MTTENIFVTCGSELEALLEQELRELGFKKLKRVCRGVYIDHARFEDVYHVNYCSRIATRVLWPLRRFRCPDKEALYKNASMIEWEKFLRPNVTIAVDSNVSDHPNIRNSHFAALVVKDALCDRLRDKRGFRPNVDLDNPGFQLNLHISNGWATLALDTSGIPLHKRGYRQEGGEAPLQENLAAAILRLVGYKGEGVLCDPLCGSGTFLIEAALIATDTAPGFLRRQWGFMHHPAFSMQAWLKYKNSIDRKRKAISPGLLYGIERDSSALLACRRNLRACGLGEFIKLFEGDFNQVKLPKKVEWIVANPPYGRRILQEEGDIALYQKVQQFINEMGEPHAKCAIMALKEGGQYFGQGWKTKRLVNGGLPINLWYTEEKL